MMVGMEGMEVEFNKGGKPTRGIVRTIGFRSVEDSGASGFRLLIQHSTGFIELWAESVAAVSRIVSVPCPVRCNTTNRRCTLNYGHSNDCEYHED
jgi:hypothetical protein